MKFDDNDTVRNFSHNKNKEVSLQVIWFLVIAKQSAKPTRELPKESGEKKVAVIVLDEEELLAHISGVVRSGVEETLNGPPEAEANALWGQSL